MGSAPSRLVYPIVVLLTGCASARPAPSPPAATPIDVPPAVALASEDDYREQEAVAKACMRWLLDTHPASDPNTWVRVRDFALDWIEGAPHVDASPRMEVLERVLMDHRYYYSRYMRGAYLSARTLFLLEHPDASPVEAEIAAIHGMQGLHAVFAGVDPEAKSKPLRRYQRLERRGKLSEFVAKKLGER